VNRAVAYLGPLSMAAGAWLTAPSPHPVVPETAVLGLAGAALALALLGVALGRQWVVGLGLAAGVAATLPPVVPVLWLGPILLVLGAALALEGAAAGARGLELPPLRAWGFPLGLTLVAALVPLAAFATQSGRESLDITQGMGLGVTAPFLLAAAWAGWTALERRRSDDAEGSPLVPAVLALVLVLGGLGLGSATVADAQGGEFNCEDPRTAGFEQFSCQTSSHVLAREETAQNVTTDSWRLNQSRMLLIDPGFRTDQIANLTFQDVTLDVPLLIQEDQQDCSSSEVALDRATSSWTEATTVPEAPDGEAPITVQPSAGECAGGELSFNVTDHFQAWADGAPLEGWRLYLTQGYEDTARDEGFGGLAGPYDQSAVFDTNPPRIEDTEVDPAPANGTLMAPVDRPLNVTTNVTDPRGGLRNGTLTVDDETATAAPLDGSGVTNLSYTVEESTANGTLALNVSDWDGNTDRAELADLRPDRDPPELAAGRGQPLETTDEGFRVTEPVPEGADRTVAFNVTDDACEFVDPCASLEVRNETGDLVAERSVGPATTNVSVPLPSQDPPERTLSLHLEDAAGRSVGALVEVPVEERRSPDLRDLRLTDAQGREDTQEAGLPLEVRLGVADESPPIEVQVSEGDTDLATATVEATNGTVELAPVLDEPGTQLVTVAAEDRWGNQASQARAVAIEAPQDPIVTVPAAGFVPSQAVLDARVEDASVGPDDVDVEVTRGGSSFESAVVDRELAPDGVNLTVRFPELLHGEDVGLTVSATDGLDRFGTDSVDLTVDARGPEVTVAPQPGARSGGTIWSVPDGTVVVDASDPASGLAALRVLEPFDREVSLDGETFAVDDIGQQQLGVRAEDAAGNPSVATLDLRLDDEPPTVDLDVDGHALVVTVEESGSGLDRVELRADGDPLAVPSVPGTHEVEVPGVTRGDEVTATLTAVDRVAQEAELEETVTIEDAPPQARLVARDGGQVSFTASDPDGDEVDAEATATHLVNGTTVALPVDGDGIQLPDWRGDVRLALEATASEETTTSTRTYTLGEGPFLDAEVPDGVGPGDEATIEVSWLRDYESVTVVATDEGTQAGLAEVEETGPGQGQATLTLDEEGTYDLELRGQHADGSVETQSLGGLEVEAGPSPAVLVVAVLLLVALVGLLVLTRVGDEEEAQAPGEGGPAEPP